MKISFNWINYFSCKGIKIRFFQTQKRQININKYIIRKFHPPSGICNLHNLSFSPAPLDLSISLCLSLRALSSDPLKWRSSASAAPSTPPPFSRSRVFHLHCNPNFKSSNFPAQSVHFLSWIRHNFEAWSSIWVEVSATSLVVKFFLLFRSVPKERRKKERAGRRTEDAARSAKEGCFFFSDSWSKSHGGGNCEGNGKLWTRMVEKWRRNTSKR